MKHLDCENTDIVLLACHSGSLLQSTPLGVGSLCASLHPSCHAEILNLAPDFDIEGVCNTLSSLQPKIVGFSIYVWNRSRLFDLALMLRDVLPDAVFIAGGPEASCSASIWDQHSKTVPVFDIVIQGPAESLFNQVVEEILGGAFFSAQTTKILRETGALLPESPWLNGIIEPQRGVLLETARGCPFRCAYCFDARGSRKLIKFPHQRLRQELKKFVESGVEQVWILDSSFNVPSSRGKELLRLFHECAPGLHYHLEAKAEYIDTETAQLLAQLSCSVQVGLQSVHADVLKNVDRTLDMPHFEAGLFELYQYGITYGIDLIYGLPGDTYSGLCESLECALAFCPNQIELFPLALLPGTVLEQKSEAFAIDAFTEPPYTVLSTSTMNPEAFARAELLTAALNLFYNTGRAVAYFQTLCDACNIRGIEFLECLGRWLKREGYICAQVPVPDWDVEQAHVLQIEFIRSLFSQHRLDNLIPAAEDIMRYHYHYAEAILAPAVASPVSTIKAEAVMDTSAKWDLAEGVQMGTFTYPVELYHNQMVEDLVEFVCLHAAQECAALFYADNAGEVRCKAIPKEVMELFRYCSENTQLPTQFGTLGQEDTCFWIKDAIALGILVQCTS